MKKWVLLLAASLLASVPTTGYPQTNEIVIEETDISRLPQEVKDAIQGTEIIEILPINGVETFDTNIINVGELIFQRNSTIEFTKLDVPYLIIYAKRVRVIDPNALTTIRRSPSWSTSHGEDGSDGRNGVQGGRSGRHGLRGTDGMSGTNGIEGTVFDMPPIYIIFEKLELASNSDPLRAMNIAYHFTGVAGPNGGNGGNGGIGGKGGKGRNWRKANPFGCGAGPGDGGDGANGGKGGDGADAQRGGNGSAIRFVAPREIVDVLSLGHINNYGGIPGEAGARGEGGARGTRGSPGNKGDCSSGDYGRWGKKGEDGQPGAVNNKVGKRGIVQAIILNDTSGLFQN